MSNSISEIKQFRWEQFLTRPYLPFFASIHARVYIRVLPRLLGHGFKHFLYISRRGLSTIYRPELEERAVELAYLDLATKNREKLSDILSQAKEALKNIQIAGAVTKVHGRDQFKAAVEQYSAWFALLTTTPYMLGLVIEKYLDPKDEFYRRLLSELSQFRNADYYQAFEGAQLRPFLDSWSAKHGLNNAQARLLMVEEILSGQIMKWEEEIKRRQEQFVIFFHNGRTRIISEQGEFNEITKMFESKSHKADAITGQAAYVGKARGRVKIVNVVGEINKIQAGDILVSVSTNPTLLPAIRRAAAIVTDEGGIMSHAAIISRE